PATPIEARHVSVRREGEDNVGIGRMSGKSRQRVKRTKPPSGRGVVPPVCAPVVRANQGSAILRDGVDSVRMVLAHSHDIRLIRSEGAKVYVGEAGSRISGYLVAG